MKLKIKVEVKIGNYNSNEIPVIIFDLDYGLWLRVCQLRVKLKMAEFRYGALDVEIGSFFDNVDSLHILFV